MAPINKDAARSTRTVELQKLHPMSKTRSEISQPRNEKCWLVIDWVTPSRSHVLCQNRDLFYQVSELWKKKFRSTQRDILRHSSK